MLLGQKLTNLVSNCQTNLKLQHPPRSIIVRAEQTHGSSNTNFSQIIGTRIAQSSCAALLSLALTLSPASADVSQASNSSSFSPPTVNIEAHTTSAATVVVSNDFPFLDMAKVMPSAKIDDLQSQLKSLEADTGYKVRVLTRFGPSDTPSIEEIRKGWCVDDNTIVIFVDPSAPNISSFKYGKAVQKILRRPFFTELQSRYGNLYYVRENGEQAAVNNVLNALDVCLRKGGCAVPPGLPQEQYVFTLVTSIAGGFILGAALRLEPQGFVKRQWVYALLFAPLWATLAINFGIGPVVSRTDDILPVAANVLATLGSAALIKFYPQAAKATGLTIDEEPMNSDWE